MVNHTSGPSAASAMANETLFDTALPPLPTFSLEPTGDVFAWISDFWLSLLLPVAAYWALSILFHVIDVLDLFPQYRLHTPDEILRRNHASRFEVARDVVIQQVIQVVTGAALAMTEPPEMHGKAEYDVAVWATRLRLAQRALPALLGLLGLNATTISKSMSASHPLLAGALAGGYYPFLASTESAAPTFAPWELTAAKLIYHVLIPGLQFLVAVFILDTWQYFLHRLMHMNRWLYTTFHSRHHRLYVPYAYGALYNHPFEGFLLDTLGAAIAFKVTGLTLRQGTCFFTFSTIKTIDDHCGYAFPWDPLQLITSNNAAYHDIHHQTWGIKANFSQPFFTFWDTLLGTKYKGSRTDRLADKKRTEKTK
ncbi:Sphingolipid C4-hydroxylase SUR2 [Tolypocladium ophioglossoides CBS 100239]|uniref:Sphingolipid C4-hydroxylase SUR2 n=1 Tax=Tolypocladium ophioglossoides (strain CBS 100239) TaxID=1163406 RepID=A0A0L0NC72_TOLOC|nr:Sphingolipid C4-hydroxylase SUR2 [Tolypocladium ophioglossoides CBS 100239]